MTTDRKSITMASPSKDELGTYGAHLLVDYKPIQEADELLAECEQFIEESKEDMFILPFAAFSRVAANIKAWRAKRKDSKLIITYQQLQPRIASAEKNLRAVIGEVVEKKGVLRLQGRHLQARLESCVSHNKRLLQASDGPLEETRSFVNVLSSESTTIKDAMVFNTEVLRLKKLEEHAKNMSVLRWGKPRQQRAPQEPNLAKDDDHNALEARLLTFRDLREKFVSYLAYILEQRGIQQSNLDNCLWSLDAIKSAVKREGVALDGEDKDSDIQKFDHSRCTDCSIGYSMSCDCMSHFTALQKQAQDANQRLLSLVEIRERMSEAVEALNKSLNEDGSPNSELSTDH